MSWRDVPMPTAVAKLPRDKRGFPVPWVSEWHPDDARIGYLRWGHPNGVTVETAFADCECEIGVGEPNLGAPRRTAPARSSSRASRTRRCSSSVAWDGWS